MRQQTKNQLTSRQSSKKIEIGIAKVNNSTGTTGSKKILKTTFTKGCGTNCGCRKVCRSCRDQSCFYAMSEDTTVESELNDNKTEPISLFSSGMIVTEYQNSKEVKIEEIDTDEGEMKKLVMTTNN